jgi:Flp pilus assembly secretin CpaC
MVCGLLATLPILPAPVGGSAPLHAQQPATSVTAGPRVEVLAMQRGRAVRVATAQTIGKVTVANPEVVDVVVANATSLILNANTVGETDLFLLDDAGEALRHLRVTVQDAPRVAQQVALGVKFAEVRTSALRQISTALGYRNEAGSTRADVGTSGRGGTTDDGAAVGSRFLGVLSTFNSTQLLGLIEAEAQRGNARFLAEPTLTAALGESASFLAGGEIPVPIVQGGMGGGQQGFVSIQFREFGVRLAFKPISATDSLLRLFVNPEVSSLDYSNSVTLQGFQVPALRTRRVESTVDVRSDRSLVISGLFNEEREAVRTGVPWLMDVPLLGSLFSSRRWLANESELIVIVTPVLFSGGDTLEGTSRTPSPEPGVFPLPGTPGRTPPE